MGNNGKRLEALVATVEEFFLPKGFSVTQNKKILSEDGLQLAELDILIEVCIGTASMSWLLECRDRPSAGPQGVDWIEQLSGRRGRFKLNKVTAVSTTGFTEGARRLAQDEAIDVREVREFSVDSLEWVQLRFMTVLTRHINMTESKALVEKQCDVDVLAALRERVRDTNEKVFESEKTGNLVSALDIYSHLVGEVWPVTGTLVPGDPPTAANLNCNFEAGSKVFVRIGDSKINIEKMLFTGDVRVSEVNHAGIRGGPLG
jgi:hypothetical protein